LCESEAVDQRGCILATERGTQGHSGTLSPVLVAEGLQEGQGFGWMRKVNRVLEG
jgi:hypothetical protein